MNTQVKSAIILIDNLLNNPQKYSRKLFAEKLEGEGLPSSESTITRLLQFIYCEFGIKIKVDKSKFIYGIDYNETSPNFTEEYYRYKNLYFRNLLHKTTLEQDIANQYISFGFATNNKNIEYLNPLLTAILENRKVELKYLPFYQTEASIITVSPIFIKEYLNRWYLITEKLDKRHPIFAIDRIQSYEILKAKFKRTNEINTNTFKNTIGIHFSNTVEKVKLWVSQQQYPYSKTLPFHISQKTEQELKDGFIISFELTLNFELKQWILFFGNSIKVLEPKSLKEEIISELKQNLEKYRK